MKAKDLTQGQKLAVQCQTCGARPGERCGLNSGGPRTAAHRARGSSAADAVTRQNAVLKKILVVDDDEEVLKTVVAILKRANFRVLSANSGPNALKVAEEADEKIDLLLSDLDMAQMSGADLGEALKKTRPDLHVMLMSGGAKGSLLVLNYGWAFIQKPFVPVKLVQMITDVLHSPNRSQPGGQEFDSRKDTR
jgi:DNA-binding NtrC family response regulator